MTLPVRVWFRAHTPTPPRAPPCLGARGTRLMARSANAWHTTLSTLLLLLAHASPTAAWSQGASALRCGLRARAASAPTTVASALLLPSVSQHRFSACGPWMAAGPPVPSVSKAALVDAIALKAGVSKKTAAVRYIRASTSHEIRMLFCENSHGFPHAYMC